VLTIALFGDVEVLHARYLNRMTNENRHSVHLSTTIDKFEDFKKCSDYLKSIDIPGEVICIDRLNIIVRMQQIFLRRFLALVYVG